MSVTHCTEPRLYESHADEFISVGGGRASWIPGLLYRLAVAAAAKSRPVSLYVRECVPEGHTVYAGLDPP